MGQLSPLGSGSDFTSFWNYIGVPSLDWGFRSAFTNAPYHSAYDDLQWMDRFGSQNGTYDYYLVLARLIGTLAISLSHESTVLNVSETSQALQNYVNLLEQLVVTANLTGVRLDLLQDAVGKFATVVSSSTITPDKSAFLDRNMQWAEGLPDRPFFKNLMSAPGRDNGYEPVVLPGVWQAVLDQDVVGANVQIDNLIHVLMRGIQFLQG